jgi:hypothetical protein
MKTLVTVPVTVVPVRRNRGTRTVYCRIAAKRGLLGRFRQFIKTADWERYLCHPRIHQICLAMVVVYLLFLTPVLAFILLR